MNESLDFQKTCEYLKGQLAQINYKIHERDVEFYSVSNKGRSKSVDDEALKNYLINGFETREIQLEEQEHSNETNDCCSREVEDEFYEEENSIFKDDELEKTLIDSSAMVSTNTENLNVLIVKEVEAKCEKVTKEEVLNEEVIIQETKSESNDEIAVEITSSTSSTIAMKVVEESNVFEKFFKSFNTALNSDELKKQNAENYNKIVDLLKKSNQKQPIVSNEDGLIITEKSPKPKMATELFKQEPSSPPPPVRPPSVSQTMPVITITTDSISRNSTVEDGKTIDEEKKAASLMSKQLVDTSSTDLIKLLLKIDGKKIDSNLQKHQPWVITKYFSNLLQILTLE